mmetsp:Transcript_32496/g.103480  ORF Transcript_32496/g.103480 Transcript_32496/m.103480 type:complete len:184 (+) Transcript_32496:255-806(+)
MATFNIPAFQGMAQTRLGLGKSDATTISAKARMPGAARRSAKLSVKAVGGEDIREVAANRVSATEGKFSAKFVPFNQPGSEETYSIDEVIYRSKNGMALPHGFALPKRCGGAKAIPRAKLRGSDAPPGGCRWSSRCLPGHGCPQAVRRQVLEGPLRFSRRQDELAVRLWRLVQEGVGQPGHCR